MLVHVVYVGYQSNVSEQRFDFRKSYFVYKHALMALKSQDHLLYYSVYIVYNDQILSANSPVSQVGEGVDKGYSMLLTLYIQTICVSCVHIMPTFCCSLGIARWSL